MITTTLDRRSGEPIVTETRAPGPFGALPRAIRDRVLGYAQSKLWVPLYQSYTQGMQTGVSCWKCGRNLIGWAPALRRPAGWKAGQDDELVLVNGAPAVCLLPFNHYREGAYAYQRPDGVASWFSYLHCADCTIKSEDGPDLLACFLAGHDTTNTLKQLYAADAWAQWMWRWSNITLMGLHGRSKGPHDLMKEAK